MSMTSGRNLVRFPLGAVLEREDASCSSLASGRVDKSSSSTSFPAEDIEEPDEAEDRRRRFVGRPDDANTHSGVGLRRWNCCRNRFVYSRPGIMSSVSLTLNFRNLESLARETISRSSSLSSHAGASPACEPPSSESVRCIKAFDLTGSVPSSRKNSYSRQSASLPKCFAQIDPPPHRQHLPSWPPVQ